MPAMNAGGPADTGANADAVAEPQTTPEAAPPPTAPQSDAESAARERAFKSDLMDRLEIPQDLHEQILGKAEPEAEPADHPATEPEQQPAPEEAEDPEGEDEPEADDKSDPATPSPFKDPKVRKRIDRITRQREEARQEAERLKAELEKVQQQPDTQTEANVNNAVATGALSNVRNERDLNQVVSKAQSLLDWCDANPDGVTTGEGDNQRFIEPTEIASWRRNAERTLLNAPQKRQEIRDFTAVRQSWDAQAQTEFPELFNKESEDYAAATQLVRAAPWVAALPEANYVLGVMVLGQKTLQSRRATNVSKGNGHAAAAAEPNPDIPPALTPEARRLRAQVPLAPVAPRPPSADGSAAGRTKRVTDAMQQLAADPDGSARSLANAFAAISADRSRSANRGRAPVAV